MLVTVYFYAMLFFSVPFFYMHIDAHSFVSCLLYRAQSCTKHFSVYGATGTTQRMKNTPL